MSTVSPVAEKAKKTGGNRKEFVRTNISLGENIASGLILLLLVVMGVAIAVKGGRYDPNLFVVRTDALNTTTGAVEGKSQTVRPAPAAPAPDAAPVAETSTPAAGASTAPPSSDMASEGADNGNASSGGSSAPAAPAAATPALPTQPLEISLPGIKPMSDTEFYTADTLYEKIDGRSPAYQAFNVLQLRCRTFSVLAVSGSYVDVYEYRFDTPLDAFGMFSSERDPQGKSVDFAADGYSGGMGYFFRQGPVYVQIIASDQKPETLALATAIAQNRAKELPVDDTGVAARRELPATGLVDKSVEYVRDNAQGQSCLNNVFQAKYTFNGAQLSFFLMVSSQEDAAKAWATFQKFCGNFGKVQVLPDVNGAKIFMAQIFGKWKVVFLRDKEVGGAFDAADGDKARAFVEQYLQGKIK